MQDACETRQALGSLVTVTSPRCSVLGLDVLAPRSQEKPRPLQVPRCLRAVSHITSGPAAAPAARMLCPCFW